MCVRRAARHVALQPLTTVFKRGEGGSVLDIDPTKHFLSLCSVDVLLPHCCRSSAGKFSHLDGVHTLTHLHTCDICCVSLHHIHRGPPSTLTAEIMSHDVTEPQFLGVWDSAFPPCRSVSQGKCVSPSLHPSTNPPPILLLLLSFSFCCTRQSFHLCEPPVSFYSVLFFHSPNVLWGIKIETACFFHSFSAASSCFLHFSLLFLPHNPALSRSFCLELYCVSPLPPLSPLYTSQPHVAPPSRRS